MWQQQYTPIAGSVPLSALIAALPIFTLLFLLGVKRKPGWVAALAGLGTAAAVAILVYRMPIAPLLSSVVYGAAFGLFPIGWIVFWAVVLYQITQETGNFEILKDSVGALTRDRRLQALLIAFAFGAFIEGAAGFGTPVAVAAAMLAGLGFSPFYAAGICLLANTAPVAFGSIGTPIITLAGITGMPKEALSGWVGAICAPVSLIVPAYLILVMGGWKALKGVIPGAAICGIAFAGTQFGVSNFVGPEATDILSSLAAIGALVVLFRIWQPKDSFQLQESGTSEQVTRHHPAGKVMLAWAPYALLVLFVLAWSWTPVKTALNTQTIMLDWPGLHNQIIRTAPVVPTPAPYPAPYRLDWLAASGTSCMFTAILSAFILGLSPARFIGVLGSTLKRLAFSLLTIASVLALAFLMNYSGATVTLGLLFAATGVLFPFFSAMLGWLGVFLTGSDTAANALFGNLQVVTAQRLGLDPVLMAASNSSGGVMGKMISLQSIAVAAGATGMPSKDEARLFRFTLKHSMLLAAVIALIVAFYSAWIG